MFFFFLQKYSDFWAVFPVLFELLGCSILIKPLSFQSQIHCISQKFFKISDQLMDLYSAFKVLQISFLSCFSMSLVIIMGLEDRFALYHRLNLSFDKQRPVLFNRLRQYLLTKNIDTNKSCLFYVLQRY